MDCDIEPYKCYCHVSSTTNNDYIGHREKKCDNEHDHY